MSRLAISFDVDGVLAAGGYTPRWDRKPDYYLQCPLVDPVIPHYMFRLTQLYDVYIVSSRAFGDALQTTKDWLWKVGVNTNSLAGIITGVSYQNKATLVPLLGCEWHIDDDPRVCEALGAKHAILFDSPQWDANALSDFQPRAYNWKLLYDWLVLNHSVPSSHVLQDTLPDRVDEDGAYLPPLDQFEPWVR